MKKLIVIMFIVIFFCPQPSLAGGSNLTFENVYHKGFYMNPWITTSIIAAVTATAAVVTVYTAGTGAPAAATGVSSVSSWLAGVVLVPIWQDFPWSDRHLVEMQFLVPLS